MEGGSEMKRLFRSWIFYAWLLIATIALSFIFGNNPEICSVLNPSESFALWLIEVYGSSNGEELADLELLYVSVCSFLIIFIMDAEKRAAWDMARS